MVDAGSLQSFSTLTVLTAVVKDFGRLSKPDKTSLSGDGMGVEIFRADGLEIDRSPSRASLEFSNFHKWGEQ